MPNVFAYGTLMFPEVAGPIAGISQPGEPVTLLGYRRYEAKTRKRGNYPAIIKDKFASVDGLLFRNLSESQMQKLDDFEYLVGNLYERKTACVQIGEDKIEFEIYVAGSGLIERLLEPFSKSWNPVLFQRDELDWYVGDQIDD